MTGRPDPRPAETTLLSLQAINGWRGPGALAIAFGHFAVVTDLAGIDRLQCIAVLVDLFFVLSGILIAQSYGSKLRRWNAIPEYAVRRFGRIWPVHAATLAVLVIYECGKLALVVATGRHFPLAPFSPDGINLPAAIPSNLLLLHSLGLHDRETWNFPSWSLSVEFVVYLVFALFCLVAPVPRRILAVATIMLSLMILMFVAPHGMRSTSDFGLFRCLSGFFAGTLVYEIAVRWPLPRWPLPTLVESLALTGVVTWIAVSAETWMVYAAPFVFCGLILVFLGERGAVSRLFRSWLFQKGAELSFAIYMVHAIVLVAFLSLLHEYGRMTNRSLFVAGSRPWRGEVQLLHIGSPAMGLLVFALYGAAVVILAVAAYAMVEVPGRALFNRIARTVRAEPPRPRPVGRLEAVGRSETPEGQRT